VHDDEAEAEVSKVAAVLFHNTQRMVVAAKLVDDRDHRRVDLAFGSQIAQQTFSLATPKLFQAYNDDDGEVSQLEVLYCINQRHNSTLQTRVSYEESADEGWLAILVTIS
jgi:hypothetical protein